MVACVSVTKILDIDTYFYEVNANHGSWPTDGFCRVISKVEITDSESHGLTDFGHPGVMYNVVDENNFDVVYFRLGFLLRICFKNQKLFSLEIVD